MGPLRIFARICELMSWKKNEEEKDVNTPDDQRMTESFMWHGHRQGNENLREVYSKIQTS